MSGQCHPFDTINIYIHTTQGRWVQMEEGMGLLVLHDG